MQRADRGAVELIEREVAAFGHDRVGGRAVLELAAEAIAQLRAGLLGERDRRDRTELDGSRGDQREDAIDQ